MTEIFHHPIPLSRFDSCVLRQCSSWMLRMRNLISADIPALAQQYHVTAFHFLSSYGIIHTLYNGAITDGDAAIGECDSIKVSSKNILFYRECLHLCMPVLPQYVFTPNAWRQHLK